MLKIYTNLAEFLQSVILEVAKKALKKDLGSSSNFTRKKVFCEKWFLKISQNPSTGVFLSIFWATTSPTAQDEDIRHPRFSEVFQRRIEVNCFG